MQADLPVGAVAAAGAEIGLQQALESGEALTIKNDDIIYDVSERSSAADRGLE